MSENYEWSVGLESYDRNPAYTAMLGKLRGSKGVRWLIGVIHPSEFLERCEDSGLDFDDLGDEVFVAEPSVSGDPIWWNPKTGEWHDDYGKAF